MCSAQDSVCMFWSVAERVGGGDLEMGGGGDGRHV